MAYWGRTHFIPHLLVDHIEQVLCVLIPLRYGLPLRLQLALQSRIIKRS